MIEEDRVEHLASGIRQTERDVADAEDRLRVRQRFLDQADAFDRLDRAADVVLVAGRAREDERVEDDVARADAEVLREQLPRALRDLDLALARDRLRLLLVLVDAADDERSAVRARERRHALELLEPVFEVDRVDDRLALAVGQRAFERDRIGRVDHDRRADLLAEQLVEAVDVHELVAIGVLQVHVDDLRAALHLLARDLAGLFVLLRGDQPLELLRADLVRPLADDQRAVVVRRLDEVDAGVQRAAMLHRHARPLAVDHRREGAGVVEARAAAAADDVEPALIGEALEHGRHLLRRLLVAALLVGQPGVRPDGHAELGRRRRASACGPS